jgi:hypothetical protein
LGPGSVNPEAPSRTRKCPEVDDSHYVAACYVDAFHSTLLVKGLFFFWVVTPFLNIFGLVNLRSQGVVRDIQYDL